MSTVELVKQYVDTKVFVEFEQVLVGCTITDVRQSYGNVELKVKPIYGDGQQWVRTTRIGCPPEGIEA